MKVSSNSLQDICDSYGMKQKPASIKDPQAHATVKGGHQVIMMMLCTGELDMAKTVGFNDITFLSQMQHGMFAPPTTLYSKTPHVHQVLVVMCYLTSHA